MNEPSRLAQLIDQIAEAFRTYDQLAFDEEYEHKLGNPCLPEQLAMLERKVGTPLPPSYRAFLQRHNGWGNFAGDGKLLAVEDHQREWVNERLADMQELFAEFEQENPFQMGSMPVMLGEDSDQILYLDPHSVHEDGEMDFVLLDNTIKEKRFPDFTTFLFYKLDLLRRMIDNQTKGRDDG